MQGVFREYLVRTIRDTRERDAKEWLARVAVASACGTLPRTGTAGEQARSI